MSRLSTYFITALIASPVFSLLPKTKLLWVNIQLKNTVILSFWGLLCLISLNTTAQTQAEKVYLFSFFKNNGESGLHLAYSQDGLKWEALNEGKSFLQPLVGESVLMRDPCITRGPEGRFHMVWTTSWNGKTVGYASSADLINWTPQKAIPVMEHEPEVQNCWAPEIYYDTPSDQFMIYWSSTIPGRFPETDQSAKGGRNHRIYYTLTTDFETFTPTELLYEPGFNVIDGSIVRMNGKYAMFVKDESLYPEAEKNIRIAYSDQLTGPYTEASMPITGDYWAEGPTAIQIEDTWHVYFDKYRKGAFGVLISKDGTNWTDKSDQLEMPEGIRHGTIFTITEQELDVIKTLAPDLPVLYRHESRKGRPYAKDPSVVKFKGKYWMFHSIPPYDDPPANTLNGWHIGVAQSEDLIHWQNTGEILPDAPYEQKGLCAPEAIVLRDTLHVFYQTYGNREKDAICHAWSVDGETFHRNPTNPIFAPSGDWNIGRAIDAEVYPVGDSLLLYWATRDKEYKRQFLGVSSAPLRSDFRRELWNQRSEKPLLEPKLDWEMNCIEAATICEKYGMYFMFYAGAYNHEGQQIGLAVSEDGISWRRLYDQPFLPKGPVGSWNETESGHPGVFKDEDGKYYLFYQGNPDKGYSYYLSVMPLEWKGGIPVPGQFE